VDDRPRQRTEGREGSSNGMSCDKAHQPTSCSSSSRWNFLTRIEDEALFCDTPSSGGPVLAVHGALLPAGATSDVGEGSSCSWLRLGLGSCPALLVDAAAGSAAVADVGACSKAAVCVQAHVWEYNPAALSCQQQSAPVCRKNA